jgi:voltage-gated potassium channel
LGIIDFLAIIPTYLSFFLAGTQYLLVIRTIRLLRVFRIFKLKRFTGEAEIILNALKASKHKIFVFFLSVVTLVIIMGTFMYLLEGEENGFTSIPVSIYWAIITLTTVGYGDIAPITVLGRFLASFIMIIGYSIIAVPTGIVTSELTKSITRKREKECEECGKSDHEINAAFCSRCGASLKI